MKKVLALISMALLVVVGLVSAQVGQATTQQTAEQVHTVLRPVDGKPIDPTTPETPQQPRTGGGKHNTQCTYTNVYFIGGVNTIKTCEERKLNTCTNLTCM